MRTKRKKVSGFTLLELIIVMAIFSGIIAGAMAMIKPAMQLFNKTSSQEGVGADIDNISRYMQDNLMYADRVNIYHGYGFENIDSFLNNEFSDILTTFEKNESTKIIEKKRKNAKPLDFFRKYYYPDSKTNFGSQNVYIMEISKDGFVKIYTYSLDTNSELGVTAINESYYDDYKFSITEWDFAPPKLNITMNMEYNGVTKEADGKNRKLNQEAEISLEFANISVRSEFNVINEELLEDGYTVAPNPGDEKIEIKDNMLYTTPASSYKNFSLSESDLGYKEGNTYIVYTVPEIIVP